MLIKHNAFVFTGWIWCLCHTPLGRRAEVTDLEQPTTQCGQSFQNPWIWTFCSTKAFFFFFLIEG